MRDLLIYSLVILISFSFISLCISYEDSFTVCDIQSYAIFSDDLQTQIYIPCSGDVQAFYLHVINPDTLQTANYYQFDGLIQSVHAIDSGQKLLVALSVLDSGTHGEGGILLEIDTNTGAILRSLNISKSPEAMTIDATESYAFLSIGIQRRVYPPPMIIKINLSTFQIENEVVFGESSRSIKLSSDGSKLYVQSRNIFPDLMASQARPGVAIFDATDLSRIGTIVLDSAAFMLEMSPDGSKLFISSSTYFRIGGSGANLYVVDTQTDEIIERLIFDIEDKLAGTFSMIIDAVNNKLYSTALPSSNQSNLIIEVDLEDYTYSFFEMGDKPLGRIALAQTANGPRLFAIEEGTPVVHYKDVKCLFNQDPICVLDCPTLIMPEVLPVAVAFDASGSYDPDGDPITYHWDFNGDGIFDGVGDEYTGDPWNPTYEFTSYGEYEVSLKVMDECGGECVLMVVIEIV